jgi:hypothetical protein
MGNDLFELVRFQYVWQAQILSAILEEASIDSYVTEANALEPAMGFVIYVNQQNSTKAQELLKEFDESNTAITEDTE